VHNKWAFQDIYFLFRVSLILGYTAAQHMYNTKCKIIIEKYYTKELKG
jgi:hypothetical protein